MKFALPNMKEWDISSIPDTATIVDVSLKYHGKTNNIDCHIHDIDNRPNVTADSTLYSDIADGTEFVNQDGFPIVATNQIIDLGSNADSDLEGRLTDNWWAIGLTSDNELSDNISTLYPEEDGAATPPPTLMVNYTAAP